MTGKEGIMEREEFKKIIAGLNSIYSEKPPVPNQIVFDIWFNLLGDKPYEVVSTACNVHISSSPFPPKPANILELCADVTSEPEIGGLEAWNMVYKAICNSSYNAENEYNKLPPVIQKTIGSYENLKEMAQMKIETVNSVEQSNFLKQYRITVERERKNKALPVKIREAIQQIGTKYNDYLYLEGNNE